MTIDPSTLAWLTDALLQSTALLAIVLSLHFLLKRSSAAKKHSLLLAAALGIPLLFLFSASLPTQSLPISNSLKEGFSMPSQFTQATELGAPILDQVPFANQETFPVSQSPVPSSEAKALPLSTWLVGTWLGGLLILCLRFAFGIASLIRFEPTSSKIDAHVLKIISEESQSLGIKKTPRTVILHEQAMPMTWRLRGHTLALPSSTSSWSPEKLRHVIRHELAHIQRNDCLSAWFAEISLHLLWFHPLTWLLRRSLVASREAACDDLALGDFSDEKSRGAYARHLLDIITTHSRNGRQTSMALAMARRTNGIHHRLNSILSTRKNRQPLSRRSRLLAVPIWVSGIAILASLSACRTTSPDAKPTPAHATAKVTSYVKVRTTVIEFDDPAILRKLFNIEKSNTQFTGIITQERMQEILTKFQAHPKADILTSLSVVTPLKKVATIEQISEFIYPTEYDPPGGLESNGNLKNSTAPFPVTPATPTSFETKELGLSLKVTPTTNGSSINLDFVLNHSHFLGFVNYGSPIMAPARNFLGFPVEIVITENRIEMPVFRTHRFQSEINVPLGHVIVLAGLTMEADPNLAKRLARPTTGDHPNLGKPKNVLRLTTGDHSNLGKPKNVLW